MHRILKIVPGNSDFDAVVDDLTGAFQKRQVTFFSGAGVSRPSGLPVSRILVRSLVSAMVGSLEEIGVGDTSDKKAVENIIESYPLERLLDALGDAYGDKQVLDFLSVLGNAEENYNHTAAARLAQRGWLRHLVTLNFDVLFEQACLNLGLKFSWQLPLAAQGRIGNPDASIIITKPHGTLPIHGLPYKRYFLAATLKYAGDRPQKETSEVLKSIAGESPVLLVAGYSDNDWDISPLLVTSQWSKIYWCEHIAQAHLNSSPPKYPCKRIMDWLTESGETPSYILSGEIGELLAAVLKDDEQIAADDPAFREPNATVFSGDPRRTALATIRSLDGTDNALYKRLLPKMEQVMATAQDNQLHRNWLRTYSWFNHAHKRNIRTAITIHKYLTKSPPLINVDDRLQYSRDLKTLYYEYISAAKRPYLNPRWLLDLSQARRIKKRLCQEVRTIENSEEVSPWAMREAKRQEAFTAYYKIDLFHNWGYHLLIFKNCVVRRFVRWIFRKIADKYVRAAAAYSVLDWEYHYVRRIEASLLAEDYIDGIVVRDKLEEIATMFERTGSKGHHAYTKSVLAIMDNSELEFSKAEGLFINDDSLATPAGLLRMCLFRRYFWPTTLSFTTSVRNILRYSTAQ